MFRLDPSSAARNVYVARYTIRHGNDYYSNNNKIVVLEFKYGDYFNRDLPVSINQTQQTHSAKITVE